MRQFGLESDDFSISVKNQRARKEQPVWVWQISLSFIGCFSGCYFRAVEGRH